MIRNQILGQENELERYDNMSTGSSTSEDPASPIEREKSSKPSPSRPPTQLSSPTVSSTTSEGGGSETGSLDLGYKGGSSQKEWISDEQRAAVKSAHITNEFVRLSETLEYMHPEDVKNTLVKRLNKRDSKAIIALSILFPRSKFPPLEHAHCVRCHKQYNPSSRTQCLVPHPTNQVVKIQQDSQGATFCCKSCKNEFRLVKMFFYDAQVSSYLSGLCFRGKHTANPKEVGYNGTVQTCEEHGCVELYV